MQLSIVTGTYNRLESLQRMIESARSQLHRGLAYEFVLVDGGSTDGTQEWVRQQKDCRLINGDLEGAIKAFHQGATDARGKYVILANDDIAFLPDSIIPAMMHLEQNPKCGAVAFADNRHPESKRKPYEVAYMTGTLNTGKSSDRPHLPYAQVGMFPKWLGDKLGWWGYGKINAVTYGGDNWLSANIWQAGYQVCVVEGVSIHDYIVRDELRELAQTRPDTGYYEAFPDYLTLPEQPLFEPEETESLRILYLPIYENHTAQQAQKRGLRDALNQIGWCWELDYWNTPDIEITLATILNRFKPHIVLTQFQGADDMSRRLSRLIKQVAPSALLINWNGDYWLHGLTSPDMLKVLKNFDLQLTVNGDALPIYQANKISAAFWQNAFEPVNVNWKHDPSLVVDVIIQGNNNHAHPLRGQMAEMLKRLHSEKGITYALYGTGWGEEGKGDTLYDFYQSRKLYAHAKLAISDVPEPKAPGFVSNRLFEIGAAGGAVILQQSIPQIEEYLGYEPGKHLLQWETLEDLEALILLMLADDDRREEIAAAAYYFTFERHSFEHRVEELLSFIENHAQRRVGGTMWIINIASRRGGGVMGLVTQRQYTFYPQTPLEVDSRDAELLLRDSKTWQKYQP